MGSGAPLRIFVDGDACPVREEAIRVARRHGLAVVIVSNGGLRRSADPMVRHVIVPKGADAADDWIVAESAPGDIAVTADVPLAARLVAKGVHVLGPTGKAFTAETIGMAVALRNFNQYLREAGESRGLNAGFTKEDRSRFLGELDRLARRAAKA